jgi:hypothetical protein
MSRALNAARPPVRVALAALALATSGCVVVPQTRHVYNPDCGVATKRVELEVAVIGGFHHCRGDGCAALMVTAGIITVSSIVISGSVAVVGNVLYWAEHRGSCPAPHERLPEKVSS